MSNQSNKLTIMQILLINNIHHSMNQNQINKILIISMKNKFNYLILNAQKSIHKIKIKNIIKALIP